MFERRLIVTFMVLMALFLWPLSAPGEEDMFQIARMVMSTEVRDREPVDLRDIFPSSLEKVYCFLEARKIKTDTSVTFVWFYEGKEMARVKLPLKKGPRWRTFSSKRIKGLKGRWSVELRGAEGKVLKTIDFTVE